MANGALKWEKVLTGFLFCAAMLVYSALCQCGRVPTWPVFECLSFLEFRDYIDSRDLPVSVLYKFVAIMPKVPKSPNKSRHAPLHVQLDEEDAWAKYGKVSKPGKRQKSRRNALRDEDEEEVGSPTFEDWTGN
jgi:hypothetical protein